jgi:hypothetical protein
VANFDTILSNWAVVPFTAISIVLRTASCPAGFTDAFKTTWPGAIAGPTLPIPVPHCRLPTLLPPLQGLAHAPKPNTSPTT